jgi:hypothetical protein
MLGVVELGAEPHFAPEAGDALIRRVRRAALRQAQDLEGHRLPRRDLPRAVDLAKPTFPQLREDLVAIR